MFHVDEFSFDNRGIKELEGLKHNRNDVGRNWPVVYVLNNEAEAYIGETLSASRRMEQHLQNKNRSKLTEIRIISDQNFNKSVILDLEAFLIKHIASDGKYMLQNGNNGIGDHDYYDKNNYQEEFRAIWEKLRKLGVVRHSIDDIENSDLFKYSPYKSLGDEQFEAERKILEAFAGTRGQDGCTVVIRGSAGTGKTILGIYLMKLFADIIANPAPDYKDEYLDEDSIAVAASESIQGIEKIGIVMPQKTLQTSLKDVFKRVKALDPKMVLSPADVVKDYLETGKKYDLLIVDESHRLKCRNKGHLSNYRIFDETNRRLDLDKYEGTELDWLMLCSNNQILFRDKFQTVRPCDMDEDDFQRVINHYRPANYTQMSLDTQWRCMGGNEYVDYIKAIMQGYAPEPKGIKNYDVKIYSDCAEMVRDIKNKNDKYGLCRVVAGYAWTWNRNKPDEYTIDIDGQWYRWNRTYNNWIASKTSIDEVGCIHTVQGYDLNYAGVIIGRDLRFDPLTQKMYADKTQYYDQQGKSGVADDLEGLTQYISNIYLTLLTRGIRGTYIYVCDDNLRKYLSGFFEMV